MAKLTLGVAMSHGPMVVSEVPTWFKIAAMDRESKLLVDTTGKPVTFQELESANGNRYAEQATEANLLGQRQQVKDALARLRQDVAAAEIDLFIVIGDDQHELFDEDNMPAIAIHYGEVLEATPAGRRGRYGAMVGGLEDVHVGYGLEKRNRWPGHQDFALHAISELLEDGFDISAVKEPVEPAGVGHSYGVVECQLMEHQGAAPLVPIIVNTYWPPNQPPPKRCWELGKALRRVIESYPEDLNVAIVASGGLSHFVTDEDLDVRRTLTPLREGNPRGLLEIPAHLLNSGNSEIRNWITVAACCEDLAYAWDVYLPVYRTAAGTGCGIGFARWGDVPDNA